MKIEITNNENDEKVISSFDDFLKQNEFAPLNDPDDFTLMLRDDLINYGTTDIPVNAELVFTLTAI